MSVCVGGGRLAATNLEGQAVVVPGAGRLRPQPQGAVEDVQAQAPAAGASASVATAAGRGPSGEHRRRRCVQERCGAMEGAEIEVLHLSNADCRIAMAPTVSPP